MPFISKIEARAYSRATEILERVSEAILGIFPEDIRQDVSINENKVEGQSGDSILIVTGQLDNQDLCEAVFNYILINLDKKDRRSIQRSLDLRVDTNAVFFLRIDKQGAFLGKLRLANNADVISVRFHIKDRPRCRKKDAMLFIEQHLKENED